MTRFTLALCALILASCASAEPRASEQSSRAPLADPRNCVDHLLRRLPRALPADSSDAPGSLYIALAVLHTRVPVVDIELRQGERAVRGLVLPDSSAVRLDGLPAGTYQLRIASIGYAEQLHEVTVIPATTDSLCYVVVPLSQRYSPIGW